MSSTFVLRVTFYLPPHISRWLSVILYAWRTMYLNMFFLILILNALLARSTFGLVLVPLVITTWTASPPPTPRLSARWDWLTWASESCRYLSNTLLLDSQSQCIPPPINLMLKGSLLFLLYIFWCTTFVFVLLVISCRTGSLEVKSFEDSC